MVRLGVDVGGTFTDLVRVDADGTRTFHKLPSTPAEPEQAILQGLKVLLAGAGDLEIADLLAHGTTVATNAVLERKGARVGLVVTAGLGDVLLLGRQQRGELYALHPQDRPCLVPREDVCEVQERVQPDGSVLVALTEGEIERVVSWARSRGVAGLAISLLHAYANPAHEQQLAARLVEAGLQVSASHAVVAEPRELERTSTTVLNAYVRPAMQAYVERLHQQMPARRLQIMRSDGGSLDPAEAACYPVHTLLSGPAAGVAGAVHAGLAAGWERFVTFDMGGTSCDVALCDHGVEVTAEGSIEGMPVRVPLLDIHTVGAGGGSLAQLDPGGALVVGPESAGAVPGPACYGRGDQPTVTDANLVLGRLCPSAFLGGRMQLDAQRAEQALGKLSASLGVSVVEVAAAVVRIVNAGMERAVRVISVERGRDLRGMALMCFGGGGGLHAAELARSLGMAAVIVPRSPGTLCALGTLLAPARIELCQAFRDEVLLGVADAQAETTCEAALAQLEVQGRARLGARADGARVERVLDLCYPGQSHALQVPFGDDVVQRFHALHERLYGHAAPACAVLAVGARLRLVVEPPPVPEEPMLPPRALPREEAGAQALSRDGLSSAAADALLGWQPCWVDAWVDTPVLDRDRLHPGTRFDGPALVVEMTSTTLVCPGMSAEVDAAGNIVIHLQGGQP